MSGNALTGISFVATDDSLISKNNVRESHNGMYVDAQSNGNRIESNDVHKNMVDLNNANGLAIDINQNRYSDNNCETSNPSGLCTTTTINALQSPQQSPGQSTQEQEEKGGDDKVVQKDEPQSKPTPRDNEDTTMNWDIQ